MKIFISWSGVESKEIAWALREWLPLLMETVQPWMSTEDIEAGARWNRDIDRELQETDFGLLCITRENQSAPWLMFEAGALAKAVENARVCPYLIGLEPKEIIRGPLTQFQAKRANKSETWELITTINKARGETVIPEDKLKRIFDKWWPDFEAVLTNRNTDNSLIGTERSTEDMLSEVLEIARDLQRRSTTGITAEGDRGPTPLLFEGQEIWEMPVKSVKQMLMNEEAFVRVVGSRTSPSILEANRRLLNQLINSLKLPDDTKVALQLDSSGLLHEARVIDKIIDQKEDTLRRFVSSQTRPMF